LKDDTLLCEHNDDIYNAIHAAINALSANGPQEWNMTVIGEATEALVEVMEKFGISVCYPWENEDEDICYSLQDERCESCPQVLAF